MEKFRIRINIPDPQHWKKGKLWASCRSAWPSWPPWRRIWSEEGEGVEQPSTTSPSQISSLTSQRWGTARAVCRNCSESARIVIFDFTDPDLSIPIFLLSDKMASFYLKILRKFFLFTYRYVKKNKSSRTWLGSCQGKILSYVGTCNTS